MKTLQRREFLKAMAAGVSATWGISGKTSGVTHPTSTMVATSPPCAASARSIRPWVYEPTLQLRWSAATVVNDRVAP